MVTKVNQWVKDNNGLYEYFVKINQDAIDYAAAESDCESMGGILASIKNPGTQQMIERLIPLPDAGNNILRQFWIGAYRPNGSLPWRWQDETQLDYTNWHKQEENQTEENCALIFSTFNYEWFSNSCIESYFGQVCQRNINVITTSTNSELQTRSTQATSSSPSSNQFQSFPLLPVVLPISIVLIFGLVLGSLLLVFTRRANSRKKRKFSQENARNLEEASIYDEMNAFQAHGKKAQPSLPQQAKRTNTKRALLNPTYETIQPQSIKIIPKNDESSHKEIVKEARRGSYNIEDDPFAATIQPQEEYVVMNSIKIHDIERNLS